MAEMASSITVQPESDSSPLSSPPSRSPSRPSSSSSSYLDNRNTANEHDDITRKARSPPELDRMAKDSGLSPPTRGRQKKRAHNSAFQAVAPASAPKKLKKASKKWEPEYLLADQNSPLADINLRAIFCNHPRAWSCLSKQDQAEIIALFPDGQHVLDAGTDQARPDMEALRSNDNFHHDCARYTEDLGNGLHDREWLEQAWEAHEMRKAGRFDELEVRKFEETWETNLPDEFKPRKKEAAAVTTAANGGRHNAKKEDNDDMDELTGKEEPSKNSASQPSTQTVDAEKQALDEIQVKSGARDSPHGEDAATQDGSIETGRGTISPSQTMNPGDDQAAGANGDVDAGGNYQHIVLESRPRANGRAIKSSAGGRANRAQQRLPRENKSAEETTADDE